MYLVGYLYEDYHDARSLEKTNIKKVLLQRLSVKDGQRISRLYKTQRHFTVFSQFCQPTTLGTVTSCIQPDKTKYIFMSGDQNAGRGHSMKIDNSSIERVEDFKYLGTTLTSQNSFRKKLRADWSDNACYHSVQNILSSSLLPKNIKIKIYRTVICCFVCV